MKTFIRNHIISPYLLAVFFLVHGYTEYGDFIGIGNCLLLAFFYLSIIFFSRRIWQIILKDSHKASLLNVVVFSVFFFFSAFHFMMKSRFPDTVFSSYRFLLPVLGIVLIAFFIYIKKTTNLPKLIFHYINTSLILFVLWDLIFFGISVSFFSTSQNNLKSKNQIFNKLKYKPSIYLLVFDEYAGSRYLQNAFDYTNTLDSILKKKEFHVFSNSLSNYNFTTFSIASLFNSNYLSAQPDTNRITYKDYLQAEKAIYYNLTGEFLKNEGYEIRNLSLFDWQNHPALQSYYLFPSGTLLLRNRTFFLYLSQHIGWHFTQLGSTFFNQWEKKIYSTLSFNELVEKELIKTTNESHNNPRFVYAHFMMPHPPFFVKKDGSPRPKEDVLYEEKNHLYPADKYLDNVRHTNRKIETLVSFIQQKEQGKAIIMIAGDHGFRQNNPSREGYFSNYNAVYFPPDIRPVDFPETITLVNQFRFIFNQCSDRPIPYIRDSQFFLKDADSE